jgi:hypothetical protein
MTDVLGVPPRSRHNSASVEDSSPLDTAELRAIDECLSIGKLDEAQRLLAQVHNQDLPASSYLAVRLLYLRERLTPNDVAVRLRDLLLTTSAFPEAEILLQLAEAGVPGRASIGPGPMSGRGFESLPPHSLKGGFQQTEPFLAEARTEAVEGSQDSERPTWAPDFGLSTAATQFPPSYGQGRASVPPASRKIEVDTRETTAPDSRNQQTPPPRYSRPPPHLTAGRYSLLSDPPDPNSDARRRLSRPPRVPEIVIPEAPELPTPPAADSAPASGAPPLPVFSQRAPNLGRYSITNAGSESVGPPPSLRSRPGRPSREPGPVSLPPQPPPSSRAKVSPKVSRSPDPELSRFRVPHPGHVSKPSTDNLDRQLLQGDPRPAQQEFEASAEVAIARVEGLEEPFTGWAEEASHLLMTSAVTHYFGTFDRSLHSLARLDLGLDALYFGPRAAPPEPLISMLGAYVGETLRTAHRGTWKLASTNLLHARVLAGGYVWEPFRLVHERLSTGASFSIFRALAPALAHEGTLAWFSCAKEHVPPPRLWAGPLNASVLGTLGAELLDSVWSLSCAQHYGSELDGSVESLHALDQLMDVLTRSARTLTLDQPWVMRLTALATAYVGEVLRREAGGYWTPSAGRPGEDPVVFRLSGGLDATPMTNILGRITAQKRFQLESYVRVLLRRME